MPPLGSLKMQVASRYMQGTTNSNAKKVESVNLEHSSPIKRASIKEITPLRKYSKPASANKTD